MERIKIIIVDDHGIFIAGLRLKLMQYSEQIEILADASGYEELMTHLQNNILPDVMLLDYHLSAKDGISITKELKRHESYSKIKVIILSAYSSNFLNARNYDLIREAIDANVDGYLLKDSNIDEIATTIRQVFENKTFVLGQTVNVQEINKEIIEDRRRLITYLKKHNNYCLTDKEIEILQLLTDGHSAKTIANCLGTSEEAVTNHKDNIKHKLKEKYGLDFKNVVELIVWAIKNKIVKV